MLGFCTNHQVFQRTLRSEMMMKKKALKKLLKNLGLKHIDPLNA